MTPGFGASLQAWPIHRVQPTCWYLATGTQARCHGYVRRPLSVLFESLDCHLDSVWIVGLFSRACTTIVWL